MLWYGKQPQEPAAVRGSYTGTKRQRVLDFRVVIDRARPLDRDAMRRECPDNPRRLFVGTTQHHMVSKAEAAYRPRHWPAAPRGTRRKPKGARLPPESAAPYTPQYIVRNLCVLTRRIRRYPLHNCFA